MLLCTVFYTFAVVGHSADWWVLESFGVNWAADGFCLSFKTTLYHTHLLCLYCDTILAIVLYFISNKIKDRPELQAVHRNVVSVFFHGAAHGFLWWRGGVSGTAADRSLIGYLVLMGFYFSFTHLMTRSPLWLSVLQTVLHTYVTTIIPEILVFGYVNAVIVFNLNIAALMSEDRDIFYFLEAVVIGIPITLATYLEPLLCDNFLINWGGHIIFDLSIPLGVIMYYFVASSLPTRCELKKKI